MTYKLKRPKTSDVRSTLFEFLVPLLNVCQKRGCSAVLVVLMCYTRSFHNEVTKEGKRTPDELAGI